MTATRKILGQSYPSASAETDLYTVPSLTSTVVSSLSVCNQASVLDEFRVSVSAGGGTTGSKDYIYYNVIIPPNDTFVATIGITLAATDKVRVYSKNGTTSFNLFGEETA